MNLGTLLIKLGKAEKTRAVVVDLGEGPDPSPPPPLILDKGRRIHGRRAGRASKSRPGTSLSSRSESDTVEKLGHFRRLTFARSTALCEDNLNPPCQSLE